MGHVPARDRPRGNRGCVDGGRDGGAERGNVMASINGILDLMGKLQSPGITVHQERCVLVRNRNADCLRCA